MSRTCPTCAATYQDDVFFCGEDGHIVIQDQSDDDFDPRLGKQLGGYIVAARVADGAMGRVFEGRHPETKARVAIKVLHANVARDAVAVERFRREYETAGEMDNTYIVKVLEYGETDDGSYFLTMEFLEGDELSRVTAGGPLSLAKATRVVCQAALALDHAHSFGFIHRDLKPDNLFLCSTEDGPSVRILDFGSVKLQMETGNKLTAIGTTLGSPYYMSPEQAMGAADLDQRTDVFALGAIFYEMLTSKVAFEAANVAMILMKIMNEQPAPATTINAGCPAIIDDVIDKSIAKDKSHRYDSAGDFARAVTISLGLSDDLDKWASISEAELANALAATQPKSPKPFDAASISPSASAGQPGPKSAEGAKAMPLSSIPAPPSSSSATAMRLSLVVGAAAIVAAVIYLAM